MQDSNIEYATTQYVVTSHNGKKVLAVKDEKTGQLDLVNVENRVVNTALLPDGSQISITVPLPTPKVGSKPKSYDHYPRKHLDVTVANLNGLVDGKKYTPDGFLKVNRKLPVFLGRSQVGIAYNFEYDEGSGNVTADFSLQGNIQSGTFFPTIQVRTKGYTTVDGVTHILDYEVVGVGFLTEPHSKGLGSVVIT